MSDHISPKIFTKEQIERVTKTPSFQNDLMQGISDGFVAFYRGDFFAAPIQTLGAPPMAPFGNDGDAAYAAQTCVKSGYFRNNPYYVIKVASGGHPWKENSGLMQVYSQATGRLDALLLDDGILTEIRTAALGSLAVKLLSSPSMVECIGVVGTGVQARYQLDMLQRVVSTRSLLVYGRCPDKRQAFIKEMEQQGWNVQSAEEPDELLTSCQVVVTTTNARSPVLGVSDEKISAEMKCRLIICIGADAPGKGELSEALLGAATLRVADHPEQSLERGEFQRLRGEDLRNSICPLGKLLQDKYLHGHDDEDCRLVIFDSSGVALQDCVVAQMVYQSLLQEGKD
jgi:ornithine cyclodeaminase/alanine dehydrogenase-like protein (mu-crystallin family)